MEKRNTTCEQRIEHHLHSRIEDLQKLWTAYCEGIETLDDLGCIHDYGLSFDYVAPDTFDGQTEGYFRYQISWGGPSDEFRFYANSPAPAPRSKRFRRRCMRTGDRGLKRERHDGDRTEGDVAPHDTTYMPMYAGSCRREWMRDGEAGYRFAASQSWPELDFGRYPYLRYRPRYG